MKNWRTSIGHFLTAAAAAAAATNHAADETKGIFSPFVPAPYKHAVTIGLWTLAGVSHVLTGLATGDAKIVDEAAEKAATAIGVLRASKPTVNP